MRYLIIMSIFMIISVAKSFAQYVGPDESKPKPTTIRTILDNEKLWDDLNKPIEINGFITKKISYSTYVVEDISGILLLEVSDNIFPKNEPIDDKTKVRIQGEVINSKSDNTTFIAHKIEIIQGEYE